MPQQRSIAVKVTLEAAGYYRGLQQMEAATRKQTSTAESAFKRQQEQFEKLGKVSLVASGVFTAAFVAMVKASADFEAQMSQLSALGPEYSKSIGRLSDAAFSAGKAYGLSATQVAEAQIELAKAGVSASDILGGALPGALALASAGQIDVAKATSIASTAMTQFGKSGADVPHIADLLAASADKSVASVDSVGDALSQSGLVANQFGLSIEDTVGTLTAFSKAGLNGSDAGTSFKTMLLSLASPSKQAKAALDEYNISAYDAQGNFVGITSLAKQLQAGFHGVDQASRDSALSIIFGTDAVRAANVLYKQGANITQGFAEGQGVAGFAALAASKKLDNLNGDLQKLSASFQNDLIKSGSAGQTALRGVTQTATNLLTVIGQLPAPLQGIGLGVAGVGAAVTAAGAAFLLLTPKIVAAKAAMADLNITGKGLALGLAKGGAVGLGITAITSGFANLGSQGDATAQQLNLASKSVKASYSGIDKLFATGGFATGFYDAKTTLAQVTSPVGSGNAAKILDGLTLGITHFSDAAKTSEGQFKAFGEQFGALASTNYSDATYQFARFTDAVGGGADAAKQALQVMPAYKDSIVQLLTASGQAATEQNILAAATGTGGVASKIQAAQDAANANSAALKEMSGAALGATDDIGKLADAVSGFGSVTLDARAAQRDFQAAVDDASAAAKKNGRSLDISTEAGRANQDALDNIASAAAKAAGAILKSGGSAEDAAGAIRRGRKAFIDTAVQMGLTRDKAKKLADQLNLIPGNVSTAVKVTGVDAAKAAVADIRRQVQAINGLRANVLVNVTKQGVDALNAQNYTRRASGGSITGPGPKGKDSVLIYAAPGEHVLTAREVDKMGGQAGVYAFRRSLMAYANGGAIGDAKTTAANFDKQNRYYRGQLKTAKAAESRAQKAYDDIDGKEKNRARKKAAKAALDRAEKRVSDLEKWISDGQQKADEAKKNAESLRDDREDFVSTQRRATADNPIDPLSYVDQLRSMSRNDAYSAKRRTKYQDTANAYEASIVKQQAALAKATKTLDDFTSAADSMRSSITSAIAGAYQLNNVSTVTQTGSSFMQDGISFQTASSGLSADAIDAYYRGGANDSAAFAADLKSLAARGVDGRLLAELAGYGVETGGPIAKTLLSATSGQIASINSNYSAIQGNAAAAAGTVTDVNYKALIDNAQANTDRITAQLASDGEKLRKLIASAFGLTGYAIGTASATPGWHLVGEQGPELLNFAGGEQVATAARTRAMIAGARTASSPVVVRMPDTITVRDASGFTATMRTVAQQEIAADASQDALLAWGGAA